MITRYEVSQDEWYEIMGVNPSNQYRRDHPVDQINWFNAQEFTEKLSQLSGLHFRLPYEAEWEYAARGGVKSKNYISPKFYPTIYLNVPNKNGYPL